MDLSNFAQWLQGTGIGEWMRTSVKAMPTVEAFHVMAVAVVFGSILIVDLRLLALRDTQRPYTKVSAEMLHWTWGAFVVALITGMMMFAANAVTYINNTEFWLKMLALLGAGLNMAFFQFVTIKSVGQWDQAPQPPTAARAAGALSILFWTGVIFFGRWIGFTKGYDFSIPEDLDFDFDFSFGMMESGLRLAASGIV